MLMRNDDGTYLAGPLDAILILHHAQTGRYHAALFLERPFPGPVPPPEEVKVVRLVSHGHHTEGSDTLEGAQEHVDYFKSKIDVHGNVFRDPVPWDGSHGVVLLRENWRQDPSWRPEDPGPQALSRAPSATSTEPPSLSATPLESTQSPRPPTADAVSQDLKRSDLPADTKAPNSAAYRCPWCGGSCRYFGLDTCPLRPRQIPRREKT